MKQMKQLPYLAEENGVHTLYVDDKPFIALSGELHNSSSSSLSYMEQNVWPHLRGLHLNTVIIPVFWELIEPKQGQFDFTLVEGIIKQARSENVRLVLLWFGLWKNGKSSYVPGWVKKDGLTYFRACYLGQITTDTISPLCQAAVKADRAAFKALMAYLKEIDGEQHTVIMIQIENEMGFLNSDRDYSNEANQQFSKPVPNTIGDIYGKSGNWSEVFGEEAGEYFMAYHYASAVEQIAKAGAEVYPLPMFVNAWLEQYPWRAGSYPSGGPIAKVMKVWKAAAPTICLYAPDIYLPNFAEICEEYTASGNPLFIPEARRDIVSATNVFYAIGQHNALCFAPFGIEAFLAPIDPNSDTIFDPNVLTALNINMSAFHLNGTGPYLAESYKLLGNMLGIIHQYRGTGKMKGFLQNQDSGCILSFTHYDLKLSYKQPVEGKPISGGLVIELSDNQFILAGIGFSVEVLPKIGESAKVGYIRIEEGVFEDDQWIRGRVLNGDESAYKISVKRSASALMIEAYKYE
ncbi:DUF5597 domain-containing protein [Paenibacillus sp. FSL H8-0548]|uniref:DUF5597 domain-containing protein n=1 Tax=Paenibacillus sp. FSL H8-0548 TaxID=1920422 RepID=UPI0009F98AEA|nr:DUF5597 domain-containing protein [Paenibacillus sp. FSL H8-0548]